MEVKVLWAGLSGPETGNSLVDVVYGDVNPSGRLPYTIAKNASDYPAQLVLGGGGDTILQINYTEGCVFSPICLDLLLNSISPGCSLTIATLTPTTSNRALSSDMG